MAWYSVVSCIKVFVFTEKCSALHLWKTCWLSQCWIYCLLSSQSRCKWFYLRSGEQMYHNRHIEVVHEKYKHADGTLHSLFPSGKELNRQWQSNLVTEKLMIHTDYLSNSFSKTKGPVRWRERERHVPSNSMFSCWENATKVIPQRKTSRSM